MKDFQKFWKMAESEGAGGDGLGESHILQLAKRAREDETAELRQEVAVLKGQLAVAQVYQERDRLLIQVKTLGEQVLDVTAKLRAQEPLLRAKWMAELEDRDADLKGRINRVYGDTMRQLDEVMKTKRSRLTDYDVDDLKHVLREGEERVRLLLLERPTGPKLNNK